MAERAGLLKWNLKDIAESLFLDPDEAREYFTDGRRVSFILERRIRREILKGTLASSEGAGYDLVDERGRKWEVRSISKGGVYFCPSYMVGSGRRFEEDGFLEKLQEIEGYILSDITVFPRIPVWKVATDEVRRWYDVGALGAGTKVSRMQALRLLGADG